MKKTWIIIIAVCAVLGLIVGICAGGYNSLVDKQTEVEGKAATIETQLR